MKNKMIIEGVELNPQKIIPHEKGDIYQILKDNDSGYFGFGEVYLSKVNSGVVKAWKKHSNMICNFVVVFGMIKVVIYDGRKDSKSQNCFNEFVLSDKRENYCRLTIPRGVWYGFKGISINENILLNFSNIKHDPNEQTNKPLGFINYKW